MKLERTDSSNLDFVSLLQLLDKELAVFDGDEHAFYNQYNSIDTLNHVVLIYEDGLAVSCGAMRPHPDGGMEIKRMYTIQSHRGQRFAINILAELENWAREEGYSRCLLETGKRQEAAVALYKKEGYKIIPNYGQYVGIDNSLCFEKQL